MLEEVRITRLGVIDDAVLEFSGGFNVVTGETGAGKTMVVTGLGLLFGGRADPARVRPGADRAAVEGRLRVDPDGPVARQVEEAGGDLDDQGSTLLLGRSVSAEGRSRATAGGRSVPVSLLTYLSEDLVAVHGQSDQQQLLRPGRQREALDRFGGPEFADLLGQLPARLPAAPAGAGRADRADHPGPRAGPRGRGPAPRPGGGRAGQPGRGRGHRAARGGRPAGQRRRAALGGHHRARGAARRPVQRLLRGGRRGVPAGRGPVGAGGGGAPRPATWPRSAPGCPRPPTWSSDVATELASYAQSVEADPARLAAVQERRAELARLVRAYGSGRDGPARPASVPSAVPARTARRPGRRRAGRAEAGRRPGRRGGAAESGGPPAARRRPGRRAALGQGGRGPARRPGQRRRQDRRADGPGRPSWPRTVAELAGQLTAARTQTAGRFAEEVTAELAALAMPHARLDGGGDPGRRVRPARRRRGRDPAGRPPRLPGPAAGQGRLGRRAVAGHAGHRGRVRRRRPGARPSCSTRSTPGSAARRRSRSAAGWPGWPGWPR